MQQLEKISSPLPEVIEKGLDIVVCVSSYAEKQPTAGFSYMKYGGSV